MSRVFILLSVVLFSTYQTEQAQFLTEDYINRINNEARTWKAGKNFPTDTPAEYFKSILGSKGLGSSANGLVKTTDPLYENLHIPRKFDARKNWRHCKTIGHIRDQGRCGSSWAMSTTSAFSDRLCIATNNGFNQLLSAEQLTFCCYSCGLGCNGGYPIQAWKYFKHDGVVTGGDYGSKEGCKPYSMPPFRAGQNASIVRSEQPDLIETTTITESPDVNSNGTQTPYFNSTTAQTPYFNSTTEQTPYFNSTTANSTTTQTPYFNSTTAQTPYYNSTTTQTQYFNSTTEQTPYFNSTTANSTTAQTPYYNSTTTQTPDVNSTTTQSPQVRHSCNPECNGDINLSYEDNLFYTRDAYHLTAAMIQKDVVAYGPIETSFYVYDDFINYKSGVYVKTENATYLGQQSVKLIGWGNERRVPYWLMVNSWNTTWGDKGTFKIRRGTNECGIEDSATGGVPVTY